MRRFLFFLVLLSGMSGPCFTQVKNVRISGPLSATHPVNPSIAIHRSDPSIMVAASSRNSVFFSRDGGDSWGHREIESTWGVWGNPSVVSCASGDFYYFHLSNPPGDARLDRIVCHKIIDFDQKATIETFLGLNHPNMRQDRVWAAAGLKGQELYVVWTQFDLYGSQNYSHESNILLAHTLDGGMSWSEPVQVNTRSGDCMDADGSLKGGVPVVGPHGQVMVSWADQEGIWTALSTRQGRLWKNIKLALPGRGNWSKPVPGIHTNWCHGRQIVDWDGSGGSFHDTVYLCWADQQNGDENTDVWISRSHDQGNTWSQPLRVNDDRSGRHQFFPWMCVDQTDGTVYVVFYDRRHYEDERTDVFLAVSRDGGITFKNMKISRNPFTPDSDVYWGDHIHLTAWNGVVRPVWIRLDKGRLSLWTALVDLEDLN